MVEVTEQDREDLRDIAESDLPAAWIADAILDVSDN